MHAIFWKQYRDIKLRKERTLPPVPFLISQTCNLLNHASNHIISHFKSLISPSSIISQSHFLVHFFPILTSVFQMSFFMLSGMFCNFNLHDLDFRQLSHVLSVLLAHICVGSKIFGKKTGLFQSSFIFLYLMGDLHIGFFFELPLSSSMRSVHTHIQIRWWLRLLQWCGLCLQLDKHYHDFLPRSLTLGWWLDYVSAKQVRKKEACNYTFLILWWALNSAPSTMEMSFLGFNNVHDEFPPAQVSS